MPCSDGETSIEDVVYLLLLVKLSMNYLALMMISLSRKCCVLYFGDKYTQVVLCILCVGNTDLASFIMLMIVYRGSNLCRWQNPLEECFDYLLISQ